jgi:hypothetical protein
VHLQFQIFFLGVIPPDPHNEREGRGREGRGGKEGREGKGRDGMNPQKTNPVYGPDIAYACRRVESLL